MPCPHSDLSFCDLPEDFAVLEHKYEAMRAKVADYADQIRYKVAHTDNHPPWYVEMWNMLQRIEEAGR